MIDQIIQFGLIKLAVISVIGLLVGIYQAARSSVDNGWTPILKEPLGKRVLNRLRGRSSASVEVRQDRFGGK